MTTQLRSNPSSAGKLTFSDLETTWRRDASSVKTPDLWPFDGLVNGGGARKARGASGRVRPRLCTWRLAAATVRVLLMEARKRRGSGQR